MEMKKYIFKIFVSARMIGYIRYEIEYQKEQHNFGVDYFYKDMKMKHNIEWPVISSVQAYRI